MLWCCDDDDDNDDDESSSPFPDSRSIRHGTRPAIRFSKILLEHHHACYCVRTSTNVTYMCTRGRKAYIVHPQRPMPAR